MLNKYSSITLVFLCFFLTSCGASEQEMKIRNYCASSASYLDAYDEDGTHFSKTYNGRRAVREICKVKASLYSQGYRIKKTLHLDDIKLYRIALASDKGLRSWYIRGIKDGMVL
jgi:hypothetical protein